MRVPGARDACTMRAASNKSTKFMKLTFLSWITSVKFVIFGTLQSLYLLIIFGIHHSRQFKHFSYLKGYSPNYYYACAKLD